MTGKRDLAIVNDKRTFLTGLANFRVDGYSEG
jgi:hypothetical protein